MVWACAGTVAAVTPASVPAARSRPASLRGKRMLFPFNTRGPCGPVPGIVRHGTETALKARWKEFYVVNRLNRPDSDARIGCECRPRLGYLREVDDVTIPSPGSGSLRSERLPSAQLHRQIISI